MRWNGSARAPGATDRIKWVFASPAARRRLFDTLETAVEALGRYKLRTSLSVLGVILGVAAVIAMMSVSEGARREALNQVQLLGLDNLVARNRSLTIGETGATGGAGGLTIGDADKLRQLVPRTTAVSPLLERSIAVSHAGRSVFGTVIGVRPSYQTILRLGIGSGRFLSSVDETTRAAVCVLGSPLARRLFGYRDPLGQFVRIELEYFRVVGVLTEQGSSSPTIGALAWRDLNNAALVPLAALSRQGLDISPGQRVDEIWIQTDDGDRVEIVGQVLRRALTVLHGGKENFDVVIPRELLAQRQRTQRTFSVVVGSVAAMALLVGGIGIMNIMLTSVVERTSEIGLRRASGATRRDITVQFLTEALLLTLSGGAIGIALGVVGSWSVTAYAGWSTYVSPVAIALAIAVSMAVGLGFGLYPALMAARLEPIDALRHE